MPPQEPAPSSTQDGVAQEGVAQDGVAALGYEQARDALADVVRRLEAGNLTLEESLGLWERGEALAEVCRKRLEGARARLEQVTGNGGGGAPDQG